MGQRGLGGICIVVLLSLAAARHAPPPPALAPAYYQDAATGSHQEGRHRASEELCQGAGQSGDRDPRGAVAQCSPSRRRADDGKATGPGAARSNARVDSTACDTLAVQFRRSPSSTSSRDSPSRHYSPPGPIGGGGVALGDAAAYQPNQDRAGPCLAAEQEGQSIPGPGGGRSGTAARRARPLLREGPAHRML